MHTDAVLISSIDDLAQWSQKESCSIIASDYTTILLNRDLHIEYFLDDNVLNDDGRRHAVVRDVVSNWYRNNNGLDVISRSNVSVGALMQYRLAIEVASVLRYCFAFKRYFSIYQNIYVSKKAPEALLMAAKEFSDKVILYNSDNNCEDHVTAAPRRGLINPPPVHKYFSIVFRMFQMPFVKSVKNKVLVINDWTFRSVKNKNVLNINSFNPLTSFCLRSGSGYASTSEKLFQRKLDSEDIDSNLKRILSSHGYDKDLERIFSSLIQEVIQNEYSKARDNLMSIYCSCREMFDRYLPSMLVVPGYAHPLYQTASCLARERGIPVLFILDGYPFFIDESLFPKDIQNKKIMVDYFGATGEYVETLYRYVFGKHIKTIRFTPPILKKQGLVTRTKLTNAARHVLIMFPYGSLTNPNCCFDKRYKYILDVVTMLTDNYDSTILIKLKTSFDKYKDDETNLLRTVLDYHGYKKVGFTSGIFSECLGSVQYVIGQIGSAIVESIVDDVPYYIYEPTSLGVTNIFLKQSVLSNSVVNRSIKELNQSILDLNHVVLDREKIYDCKGLDDVNFNEFTGVAHE
jgi:hypothetical protein